MKLKTSQKWLLVTLGIVIVLAAAAWRSKPDGKVHVYFLDVGQGDATLIVKGDIDILIDGGPSPQAIDQELGKRLPFWDRTIELLVMTHPHADHLAGLVEVLSRYKVEQVLYPALASSDPGQYDKPLFDEWLRLISEKNVISTTAQANQELALGGIVLDVLNPPSAPLTGTQSDVDNNGLIIRAQAGDMSFLVTGDVMSAGDGLPEAAPAVHCTQGGSPRIGHIIDRWISQHSHAANRRHLGRCERLRPPYSRSCRPAHE
jgi:competence protein ComEC